MAPDTTEGSKKRKRDVDVPMPRITYIAASRTFDRLFKEDSLDGMKDVVRKKLGLSTSIPVYLSQIREGKSVDLEDDDDFEAFHSSAFSTVSTKVQVVLGEGSIPYTGNQTEPISVSARRKKRKKRNSDAFAVDSSNAGPSHNTAKDAHPSTNLRVAFTEPSSDLPTAPHKLTKENAQKELVQDAFPKADQPTRKTISSSGRGSDVISLEGPEIISEKERKKKIKKDRLATASQIPEPASTTRTSDATKTTQDTNTQRTTTGEVVKPAKQSTKRKRAESPSRTTEQTNRESQKLPATSNLDAPSNDGGTEDSRARKKSKKKMSNLLDETLAGAPVPEQSKPAPPSSATQPSQPVESPAERKSRKKEKAAVDSVKKPVAEPSHDKSDGITNAKKSMKARRKSEVQPLEPPDEGLSSTKAVQERQAEEPVLPEPTKSKGKSKKTAEPPTRSSKESDPNVQKGSVKKQSEKGAAPTTVPENFPAPTKTPKKTSKKKDEVKATDPSQPSQGDDLPGEKSAAPQKTGADFKEVTRAAVQAILARKGVQSKPTTQVTTTAPPVATAPEEPPRPSENAGPAITEPIHVAEKEKNSQPEGTKDKATTETTKCDVCEESPPHPRSKCAIIKAGIRSMRKRIAELQRDTPGGEDRSKVIAELQSLIEKKTRKPRASGVPKLDAPALEEANLPAAQHVSDTPAPPKTTSKQSSTQTLYSTQPLTTPKPTSLPAPSSQPPAPQSPLVIRRSPSLQPPPSAQPRPSKQVPSQNTAKNPKRPSTPQLKGPNVDDMSLGMTPLGFGDVSGYTEKDLQELVRGPKVSLADVPSSDPSEDEIGQQEEAILESDCVDVELPRNLSQTGYPDSSDEFDNEEEEEEEEEEESPGAPSFPKLPVIQSSAARLSSGPEATSTADDTQRGNHSFQEVEALGSSRELDRTVDIAVNDVVDADLALISPAKTSQDRRNSGFVTSTSNEVPETRNTSPEIPLVLKAVEKRQELDPIEPSENPQASQPESIVSDDEFHPVESTPKEEVAVRTRSQRNKAAAPTPTPVATRASQEPVENANEPSKPTRKTRSLTKISELPVPQNPSVRIIRPPQAATTTVRTRRQMTQEESQEQEAPEPTPAKGKNTPAAKTTAKPLSKAVAKPTTKPPMLPPPPKTAAKKVPASAKSILTNGLHAGKTRGSKAAVAHGSLPEDTGPNTTTAENAEHPAISWVTLQESQASTETPGMLDELSSSPTLAPSLPKGQKAGVNGSSPLFVHADSQQSFPYSQYPDLSGKVPAASPNDSEDEDEVEATVVKPVTKSAMFRSLTEIASQPSMFRRQSSQIASVTKGPVIDYYGTSAGHEESDESGSDSDSEVGGKKVASHIPASRRAGAAVSKRK